MEIKNLWIKYFLVVFYILLFAASLFISFSNIFGLIDSSLDLITISSDNREKVFRITIGIGVLFASCDFLGNRNSSLFSDYGLLIIFFAFLIDGSFGLINELIRGTKLIEAVYWHIDSIFITGLLVIHIRYIFNKPKSKK